jgi:(p)ppGpp synthase/HD superfamily hydrolase
MPSAGITVLSDSFKDYVVSPLANGYCALTTTVSYRKQTWLLEIVTRDLEQQVDWGILSDFKNTERRRFYYTSILAFRDNFQDVSNLRYADLKSLTSSAVADIHVRCRHDRIVQLPAGSTVLDLAYILDPDLGLYCKGAMVNGRFENPLYPLRHGEHVEVQTSDEPFIQENLLTLLRSRVAVEHYRDRVKTYFMVKAYELGREVLLRFMALHQIAVEKVFDSRGEPRLMTQDEIIDIGVGKFTVAQVLESHGLFTPQGGLFSRPVFQVPRQVRSLYDHMYRMPDCCTVFPMVDREVVMQYFPDTSQSATLGLIEIHRASCDKLVHDRPRIPVEWSITLGPEMGLDLWVEDGVGLASKITGVIARNHLNIISLHADSREQDSSNQRHIFISIELRLGEHAMVDQRHLVACIKMMRGIKEIRRILIHKE